MALGFAGFLLPQGISGNAVKSKLPKKATRLM
jgi:hypothetical protein